MAGLKELQQGPGGGLVRESWPPSSSCRQWRSRNQISETVRLIEVCVVITSHFTTRSFQARVI